MIGTINGHSTNATVPINGFKSLLLRIELRGFTDELFLLRAIVVVDLDRPTCPIEVSPRCSHFDSFFEECTPAVVECQLEVDSRCSTLASIRCKVR
jgi:hypothetical protein